MSYPIYPAVLLNVLCVTSSELSRAIVTSDGDNNTRATRNCSPFKAKCEIRHGPADRRSFSGGFDAAYRNRNPLGPGGPCGIAFNCISTCI